MLNTASLVSETVGITSTTVTRSTGATVTYSGLEGLIVNTTVFSDDVTIFSTMSGLTTVTTGNGADTITVKSTAAGSNTFLDGVDGSDQYFLLQSAMLGPVFVNDSGATGSDSLQLDTVSPVGETINITNSSVTRSSGAAANYSGIESLTMNASIGSDTVNVLSTISGHTTVSTGLGNDTINVSSDAPANTGTLDTMIGNMLVDTGPGSDKIILSDQAQTTLANSAAQITNSKITGFIGPTNAAELDYAFWGTLQLTLVGSQTLNDHFEVFLPTLPGLTMQFDGKGQTSMDTVRIDGTTGNDTVKVGVFGSADPYQIQNIECLQLFGGPTNSETNTGADWLENDTATSSLIVGGDGNDTLVGGSATDVIFGGDGVDTIYGRGGGDYLFADHSFNSRSPVVFHSTNNDVVFGDQGLFPGDPWASPAGVDHIVAIGSDTISAGGQVGDTIVGLGLHITTVDWLRARFLNPNSGNIQTVINAALAQPCTMI